MESIIARALEYTLKYWLKSFSRDQFKLQGRTVQLSNLDINGDAIHSSIGLPPALNVVTAKVGKLEIKLPYLSYVQVEPIVVEIDRLDLVLKESSDFEAMPTPDSSQSAASAAKGSGYGFADKIADGMTLVVGVVNLLIEPRGGAQGQGGATWASPLASITIRNLSLYTTNENWQVVSLKEARDFSNNKKYIYVFKKLEWGSLSIDLLPHPDMFIDADMMGSKDGVKRDGDGAKRVFFGGERFLEGISGQAHITIQRTDLNSPLGLEVQLHITEALCPALSEPGLRALLRFMTGVYVCLNRGDVDPAAKQRSVEAAGCSLVSIAVDHIFLCIKDADFRLELLMQSLFFSRASVSDGGNTRNLSRINISGLFLRDTFSHPPCTLVQPLMQSVTDDYLNIPDFAKDFCPQIYPLGDQFLLNDSVPIICLHSLQTQPSPAPPTFASQTVIDCQPLMINLQEEACLRISSFLADGIVVGPGAVLPDSSINFLLFNLKELDLTVFMDAGENTSVDGNVSLHSPFGGARLHIENLSFTESPSLKFRLLNLDKDPACFCLWEDQPVDASQKKWTTGASKIGLSLETSTSLTESKDLWRCVELNDICVEAAMVTADGNPINVIPPPGGIVRIGVACQQYISNTSVEQLFFVLDLYAYLGRVSEKIAIVGKTDTQDSDKREESLAGKLMEKVPSDTAVSLQMGDLQLRFLETSSTNVEEMPLVQFIGEGLFVKVGHRTLGGAMAVSSNVRWESVQVDCVDADGYLTSENFTVEIPNGNNRHPHLRSVFWINNNTKSHTNKFIKPVPFLDINIVHVIPYNARDSDSHTLSVSAKVAGVRLGGGMNYAEALLHRFGIIGPDGGPGDGLSKGLKNLSDGPLSKLLRASPIIEEMDDKSCENGDVGFELGKPDDVDVSIELKDWLFALEGAQEIAERWWFDGEDISREERCWHTTFQSLCVKAKSKPYGTEKSSTNLPKYPVDLVTVGVEGLQALKPRNRKRADSDKGDVINSGGVNVEVRLVTLNDNDDVEMPDWVVENVKFSVKQPIEAVVTKEEVQHLAVLCKSEVESMGRIAAGILRLLKLDTSIGQSAIDQLSNLGSEGLDKMFTSETQSNGSMYDLMRSPSPRAGPSLESTITSMEVAVLESQANCSRLIEEMNTDFTAQHVLEMKQLSEKLESMQSLLSRMRSQI